MRALIDSVKQKKSADLKTKAEKSPKKPVKKEIGKKELTKNKGKK